jgi:integrase
VHGKGGVEWEVRIPAETQTALDAWLAGHPLRRGPAGLRDEQPVFVTLGRHGHYEPTQLSNSALHKLLRRYATAAGIPVRLAHPHVPRAFYATTLAGERVPVHIIARRLGHALIETTNRYLAEVVEGTVSVGDVLDRRHQSWRRERALLVPAMKATRRSERLTAYTPCLLDLRDILAPARATAQQGLFAAGNLAATASYV